MTQTNYWLLNPDGSTRGMRANLPDEATEREVRALIDPILGSEARRVKVLKDRLTVDMFIILAASIAPRHAGNMGENAAASVLYNAADQAFAARTPRSGNPRPPTVKVYGPAVVFERRVIWK